MNECSHDTTINSNTNIHTHDNNANNGVVKTLATAVANNSIETDALGNTQNSAKKSNNDENESKNITEDSKSDSDKKNNDSSNSKNTKKRESINMALLTYIASQDSTLIKWESEQLAELLSTSTELRLAVTRAMTAAVVNKVVNLYISKQHDDHDDYVKDDLEDIDEEEEAYDD